MRRTIKAVIRPVRDCCNLLLSYLVPPKPMQGGQELLDVEYAEGAWDYLRNVNELPRFSVVAGYCHHYKPGGRILEIGCGEGLLQERLCSDRYTRFMGVDISTHAIQRASARQSDKIQFVAADAAVFDPGEVFDIIVFNECLEYFDDPVSLLQRYANHLAADGLFIVSMFVGIDTIRNKRIWRMLDPLYNAVATTRVTTQPKLTWTIKVLASPPARSPSSGSARG